MSATGMAIIFGGLALVAGWAIWRDLRSGESGDSLYRFREDTNPVGYIAIIMGKAFVLIFGVLEVLHAIGLTEDPMVPLRQIFG